MIDNQKQKIEALNAMAKEGETVGNLIIHMLHERMEFLNIFLALIEADRAEEAATFGECTEGLGGMAKKIRAGTFERKGKIYHAPSSKEVVKNPIAVFLDLVDKDQFDDAVAFGLSPEGEKARYQAERLRKGEFVRKRDGLLVPPREGHETTAYFWAVEAKDPKAALAWIEGVKKLRWLQVSYENGTARNKSVADLGAARKRRAENLEKRASDNRDRANGSSSGSHKESKKSKKG